MAAGARSKGAKKQKKPTNTNKHHHLQKNIKDIPRFVVAAVARSKGAKKQKTTN